MQKNQSILREKQEKTIEQQLLEMFSFDLKNTILSKVYSFLEIVQWNIQHKTVSTLEECKDLIYNEPVDLCCVINLSTFKQVELVVTYGVEVGLESIHIKTEQLAAYIEESSALILHQIAEGFAIQALDELESFMNEHHLDFDQMVQENAYGWFRHYSEEYVEDSCTIYQYRNLEGEQIHFDIWEYSKNGLKITFQTQLEPEEVSKEENAFDAI